MRCPSRRPERPRRSCSAGRSSIATGRSTGFRPSSSWPPRRRSSWRSSPVTGSRARALRPVEAMRRRADEISTSTAEARLAGPRHARRDRPPRRHPELDARPARGVVRARTAVRRGRESRAPNTAHAPANRVGARAAAAPVPRGAGGGAPLRRARDRAAVRAHERPAADRPLRLRGAAGRRRAGLGPRARRDRRGALLLPRGCARPSARPRRRAGPRAPRRSRAARAGARQPRRKRARARARRDHASRSRPATTGSSCRSPTRATASAPHSHRGRSTASAGRTTPGAASAPGSGSRSWRRSPPPTEGRSR